MFQSITCKKRNLKLTNSRVYPKRILKETVKSTEFVDYFCSKAISWTRYSLYEKSACYYCASKTMVTKGISTLNANHASAIFSEKLDSFKRMCKQLFNRNYMITSVISCIAFIKNNVWCSTSSGIWPSYPGRGANTIFFQYFPKLTHKVQQKHFCNLSFQVCDVLNGLYLLQNANTVRRFCINVTRVFFPLISKQRN